MLSFTAFSFNYWQASPNQGTVFCKRSQGRQKGRQLQWWLVPAKTKALLMFSQLVSSIFFRRCSFSLEALSKIILFLPSPTLLGSHRYLAKTSWGIFFQTQ